MPADTPRAEAALELSGVSKIFGDRVALEAINLRVEPGESLLLYGPNGAGKTTLLRIMAGLSKPSEGKVLFGGREGGALRLQAVVGFLSHATFLYGELTARENLEFAGKLYRLSDLEDRTRAALELFGVGDRKDTPMQELSRGLQQRVALARAFLHEPRIVLLDEPFTGLDTRTTQGLGGLLRRLVAEGRTLVFSTHDFEQGATLARRLVDLDKGRVRYDGSVNQAPK